MADQCGDGFGGVGPADRLQCGYGNAGSGGYGHHDCGDSDSRSGYGYTPAQTHIDTHSYRDAHADTCPDSNTLAHSARYSHGPDGDGDQYPHGDADQYPHADAYSESDLNAGAYADPGA